MAESIRLVSNLHMSLSENGSKDILQLGPSTRKISIPINLDSIEGNSHHGGGDWGISSDVLEHTEDLVGNDVVLGQVEIHVPFL